MLPSPLTDPGDDGQDTEDVFLFDEFALRGVVRVVGVETPVAARFVDTLDRCAVTENSRTLKFTSHGFERE